MVLCCAALRTNLAVRQLAAVFDIPKSHAHRIIADLTPRLAGLLDDTTEADRRCSWTVDGTLIPTRDRTVAGKSKNYRHSTNAQILSRRRDLLVVAVDGGYRGITELHTPTFAGGRIVRTPHGDATRRRRASAEHCTTRLKDWNVLRDHRHRGHHLPDTLRAVAYLHNLRMLTRTRLRDIS